MTTRELEHQSDGALAFARGEDLAACPAYQRLRSVESRRAFLHGYEQQRSLTRQTTDDEAAEDFDANLAALKAFAKTL